MKKLYALLLVAVMILSLAGCGKKEAETQVSNSNTDSGTEKEEKKTEEKEDDNKAEDNEEVVLKWLLADDVRDGSANRKIAAKYTAETGIEIEIIEVPYADMNTKLMNMIRAGNAPALVRGTNITDFTDFLLPLDNSIDRDVIIESRRDAVLINDELVAIPSSLTANGMFYNKTAFEQAGVKVPTADDIWTWEEYIEAVEEVVEKSDVEFGLVWDHSSHRYSTLLYQFGGSIYNADLTGVTVANENGKKALDFFVSLFDRGVIPTSSWVGGEDATALFKSGKVATHFSGSWKVADYVKTITDFEWGAVYMPYEEQRSSVTGGSFIFGIDGTGVEAETEAFISWLFEPENYTEYCEYGQFLPGQSNIDPRYKSPASGLFNEELAVTPSIVGTDMTIGNKYPGRAVGNVFRDNIDLAVLGELTTQEALDNTEKVFLEIYTELVSEK